VGTPTLHYVPVNTVTGAAPDDCFRVVGDHVRNAGGEMVLGWAIWEWPRVFIEAEFHAVWKRADGALLDVTPKRQPIRRILFLLDMRRKYEGRQVDNVRHPLSQDASVRRFCELGTKYHRALNQGDLANLHGTIRFEGEAARQLHLIERERADLQFKLAQKYGPWRPEGE
jgi:hypothetical protein